MNTKEKALELVENFKGIVYPYLGSGMLVNQSEPSVILANAKMCATMVVDEIIINGENLGQKLLIELGTDSYAERCLNHDNISLWKEVKSEIENIL